MATKLLGCAYTVWRFNLVIGTTVSISSGPGVSWKSYLVSEGAVNRESLGTSVVENDF